MNTLGEPLRLKVRSVLDWSEDAWTASFSLNIVNGYNNPLFTPPQSISSWITNDIIGPFKGEPGTSGW